MISIITVAQNDNAHLNILLDAIALNTAMPREVIIIDTTGNVKVNNEYNFMIKVQQIRRDDCEFPLGAARNLGARKAWEENLIFLRTDCILNSRFVETMETHLLCADGLIMGEPRYLKDDLNSLPSETTWFDNSVYHPERPFLKKELTACYDPELFWSFCFGIKKQHFIELGGFDEMYSGQEASDLDFAYKLRKQKIDFYLSRNTVYHQHFQVNTTPSNQFETTVTNSNIFYKKWKEWPMFSDLQELAKHNYIDWNPKRTEPIAILKLPTKNSMTKTRKNKVPFSNEVTAH